MSERIQSLIDQALRQDADDDSQAVNTALAALELAERQGTTREKATS